MSEVKNIPRLRFPEFEDNWKQEKIKNLTTVKAGGTPSTVKKDYWGGNIPWMNSGELNLKRVYDVENRITDLGLKNSSTRLIPEKCILIGLAGQGKTRGTAAVNYIPLCTNQSIAAIYPNHIFNTEFLYQNIDNRYDELRRLSTGEGGRGGLNLSIIGGFEVPIPSLAEQQKIADFLTAVDKRIEILEKKKTLLETYKKGVMKKIFNQEIRFKDDNGNDFPDWEEKRLGDITNKKSSNISANSIEFNEGDFTIYGATGELKQVDFYEMEKPYISIVKDGSGVGRVNLCKPYSSVLGTLDILINNESSDLNFVYHFLSKTSFLKYVTGSSIPHIYYRDYSKLKLSVPTIKEQVRISKFLSSIDNQIELLETQIDKSKTWKKGLLQKMFV